MPLLMLADNNPILATGGEIAAIVIGLYSFIFIILTVVFGLTMDATFTWLSEKIKIVRMLRPTVDSVNKTSEALSDGVPPPDDENAIIRTVAAAPLQVHKLDQKVDQVTDKVANFAIEFRARTVQVQTVARAFFQPRTTKRGQVDESVLLNGATVTRTPGTLVTEESVLPVVPAAIPSDGVTASNGANSHSQNNVTLR